MAVELVGKLRLDGKGWRDGLTQAKGDAKRFGENVGSTVGNGIKAAIGGVLGVLGANAILSSLKGAIDRAGTLRDTSTNLRTTIEDYQAFTFALLQSGAKAEDAALVLTKLAVSQNEALGGNERYVSAFERLGVTLDKLQTKNTVELFANLADAVEKNGLNTKELVDVYEILGKGAAKVTAVLRSDFRETFAAGQAVAITADEVERLANAGDRLTTVGFQVQKIWSKIALPIVESVILAIEMINQLDNSVAKLGAKQFAKNIVGGLFGTEVKPLSAAEIAAQITSDAINSTAQILADLDAKSEARRKALNEPSPDDPTLTPEEKAIKSSARSDSYAARGLFLDAKRDRSERQNFYTKFLRAAERIEKGVEALKDATEKGFNG